MGSAIVSEQWLVVSKRNLVFYLGIIGIAYDRQTVKTVKWVLNQVFNSILCQNRVRMVKRFATDKQ